MIKRLYRIYLLHWRSNKSWVCWDQVGQASPQYSRCLQWHLEEIEEILAFSAVTSRKKTHLIS